MELVSANTKNYLFLTLSQYNELPELVRARVSMRRDQPFWEGGNSFIACESFRITAAPNEGGLYYQIVPDDFFLGAVEDASGTGGVLTELTGLAPPGFGEYISAGNASNTTRSTDKLSAKNIVLSESKTSETGWQANLDLFTCAPAAGGTHQPSIMETEINDCIPRIVRYLGQHKVTQGSLLEIKDDVSNTTKFQMTLNNDPIKRLQGPGKGPSGLFCPYVIFADPAAAFTAFGASGTPDYAKDVVLRIKSKTYSQVPDQWLNYIHQLLGSGGYLQISGAPDVGAIEQHVPLYSGAVFQIMAPDLIVTNIPGATDNNGCYTSQLRWDSKEGPLLYNSVVWMNPGHTVTGKVTSAGTYVSQHSEYIEIVVDMQILAPAKTALAMSGHNFSANTLSGFPWHMLNHAGAPQDEIVCNVTGDLVDWAPGNADPVNVSTFSSVVSWMKPSAKGSVTHMRGPSQETYVFTPNEFFYMFNEPRGNVVNPWALQTDENGGFVIQWQPPLNKSGAPEVNYHTFVISKSMTESLGLNTYMEYYDIEHNAASTVYYATLTNVLTMVELGYKSLDDQCVDIPLEQVKDLATSANIDPNNWTVGQKVYTDATKDSSLIHYVLCDVQQYASADHNSSLQRINGILKETPDGVPYYEYSKPPSYGKIGNNAQVSVESWGTFAGINLVIPNIPFQSMLGGESDSRILASLRLPFEYTTGNQRDGQVNATGFTYYGDLLYNSDSSRSYLRITTDQQLFDCDVEARLIRRDGSMEVMQIPYKGQFQVKLRLLQTQ